MGRCLGACGPHKNEDGRPVLLVSKRKAKGRVQPRLSPPFFGLERSEFPVYRYTTHTESFLWCVEVALVVI